MTTPLQTLIDELEADKQNLHDYLKTVPAYTNRSVSASAKIDLLSDTITRAKQLIEVEEQQCIRFIEIGQNSTSQTDPDAPNPVDLYNEQFKK